MWVLIKASGDKFLIETEPVKTDKGYSIPNGVHCQNITTPTLELLLDGDMWSNTMDIIHKVKRTEFFMATDKSGDAYLFPFIPERDKRLGEWVSPKHSIFINTKFADTLIKGQTWADEPATVKLG